MATKKKTSKPARVSAKLQAKLASNGLTIDPEEYAELIAMTVDDPDLAWNVDAQSGAFGPVVIVAYSQHHAAALAVDQMFSGSPVPGVMVPMDVRIAPGSWVTIEVTP